MQLLCGVSCVHLLYLQEVLAQGKGNASSSVNQEVDLDDLMDVSLTMHLYFILMFMHLYYLFILVYRIE